MALIKIQVLDRKLFDIPVNWAFLSACATFWSYGYFGSISFRNISITSNVLISLVLYGIFLTFLTLFHYRSEYKDNIAIFKKDIAIFLSFLVIMLILSFGELTNSLVGDQLFHSQMSQKHIIIILLKLSGMTGVLNNLIFSNVLFFLNLISIGLLISVYYLFKNRNFITKVILFSSVFFIFRVAIIMLGGNASAHPPLRLFPLWLSSSLLSSTDFSFRLPQFLGLIVFMWLTQRIANHKLTFLCSWLFGLAVGTIPLLLHVGTLVEQSVWTAVIWSLFLLALAESDDLGDFKWIRWFSLISLFTMLRQTAILALIPLFIFYIAYAFGKSKYDFKKLLFVLAPVLVMLPFIIRSIIIGTPATYMPGEVDYIPKDASSIERVWIALSSGIAPRAILNTVLIPWVIFAFFAFAIYSRDLRKMANTFVIFIFFVSAFFIFYSISPCLWGTGRYQAEYIVPFAILGFYYLSVRLNGTGRLASKFLAAIFVCMIFYNIFIFKNLHNLDKTEQIYHGNTILSESVYNYKDALKAVRDEGYAGHTYIAGITYGTFPEILNRFTIAEVLSTRKTFIHQSEMKELRKVSWTHADPESITASSEIKIILISDIFQSRKAIKGLQAFGWEPWKNFRHDRSGTIIYGMIRSDL